MYLHIFLTSALDGDKRSASLPTRFYPQGKNAIYQLIVRFDWPDSRARRFEKPEYSLTLLGFEPPDVLPVAYSMYRLRYLGVEEGREGK